MAQIVGPVSNRGTTNWQENAGDADADWFDELDEGISGTDDATTSWEGQPSSSTSDPIRTNMASVTDPVSSTGHIYRCRNAKGSNGGRTVDCDTEIGTTADGVIRTDNYANVDSTWTTRGDTLTAGQADSITDYGNIYIGTLYTMTGSGGPRTLQESTHEFECPDAPAGSTKPFYYTTWRRLSS